MDYKLQCRTYEYGKGWSEFKDVEGVSLPNVEAREEMGKFMLSLFDKLGHYFEQRVGFTFWTVYEGVSREYRIVHNSGKKKGELVGY